MKLKKILLTVIGGLLGAAGGFAYYFFIGCDGGSCPITSNPYTSSIYGLVAGSVLFSMFIKS